MAWQIKDEWIDLAQAKHTVIFHNPDVMVNMDRGKMEPQEHSIVNDFTLPCCKTCGMPDTNSESKVQRSIDDFEKNKAGMLAALHTHHRQIRQKLERNPKVRLGSEPKV